MIYLTDDEMFWEPFAGSWSVRRADECVTPTPFRDGDWAADFDWDLAVAEVGDRGLTPLTTIGWLLWHWCFRTFRRNWLVYL